MRGPNSSIVQVTLIYYDCNKHKGMALPISAQWHCSINGKTVVDMAQPSLYKTNLNVAKEKRT